MSIASSHHFRCEVHQSWRLCAPCKVDPPHWTCQHIPSKIHMIRSWLTFIINHSKWQQVSIYRFFYPKQLLKKLKAKALKHKSNEPILSFGGHGNMATGGSLTRSDCQTPGRLVQLGQLGGPGTRRHQKFAAFFGTYVARDKLLKSRSSAEQRLLVPCKAQLFATSW